MSTPNRRKTRRNSVSKKNPPQASTTVTAKAKGHGDSRVAHERILPMTIPEEGHEIDKSLCFPPLDRAPQRNFVRREGATREGLSSQVDHILYPM